MPNVRTLVSQLYPGHTISVTFVRVRGHLLLHVVLLCILADHKLLAPQVFGSTNYDIVYTPAWDLKVIETVTAFGA